MASTGGDNPSILQERCDLAPAFVEFALRPPFHRTGTGHRMRAGVNSELEVGPSVRRQAGGRAGQNVSELAGHGDKVRGIPVVRGEELGHGDGGRDRGSRTGVEHVKADPAAGDTAAFGADADGVGCV